MSFVTCVQSFRSFEQGLIDFLIECKIWKFLKFLGLNSMMIWCFDVVLSATKVETSLNDVMGCVGMFG